MPRALSLADHLTCPQLRQRMRQTQNARLRSHYQVIYLSSQGLSAPKIAQTVGYGPNWEWATVPTGSGLQSQLGVGYSPNWVRPLVHRYNQHGEAGLVDRRQHNPGQEPLLSPAQSAQLALALEAPPADGARWNGPKGARWNGPKGARWIAQQTGRSFVYPQQGRAYLRRLGYTAQVPRRRHAAADAAADAAAQQAFKKS